MPEVIREVKATPGTYDPKQGDFAVAGSIRMKLGYPEPGATVKGTVGSFGTKRLFLAYHPKGANDETFAAGEVYSTDGFGPSRAARRASVIAQATHDFSDGLALRVLASTYSGDTTLAGVVPAADIESGRLERFATLNPKQGGHSTRNQLLLELHKDDNDGRWAIAPFVVFRTLHLRQNFTGYVLDTQRGGKDSSRATTPSRTTRASPPEQPRRIARASSCSRPETRSRSASTAGTTSSSSRSAASPISTTSPRKRSSTRP